MDTWVTLSISDTLVSFEFGTLLDTLGVKVFYALSSCLLSEQLDTITELSARFIQRDEKRLDTIMVK